LQTSLGTLLELAGGEIYTENAPAGSVEGLVIEYFESSHKLAALSMIK